MSEGLEELAIFFQEHGTFEVVVSQRPWLRLWSMTSLLQFDPLHVEGPIGSKVKDPLVWLYQREQ